MRLDEFVAAVNKRVVQEKIRPADPRARAKVTARTIQFYVAEGLIPSPARQGSRLEFEDSHVEAVLEVKRQQAAGKSLEEIAASRGAVPSAGFVVDQPLFSRAFDFEAVKPTALKSAMGATFSRLSSVAAFESPDARYRWHVDLTDDIEISGSGRPPDDRTIELIREILRAPATPTIQEKDE